MQDRDLFIKKAQKEMPAFTESVDGLSLEDLDKNLLMYSKYREETYAAQKIDKDILATKEEIAKLSKPHDDKIKELKSTLTKIKKLIDQNVSKQELDTVMLGYTKLLEGAELAKKEDEELKTQKDRLGELSGSYSDALKALKMKISYLSLLLEEKNGPLSND
jgi:hypothetical protein